MKSNVVDWDHPDSNMYGCQPCPKCGSEYRASFNRNAVTVIECDNCGHKENAQAKENE